MTLITALRGRFVLGALCKSKQKQTVMTTATNEVAVILFVTVQGCFRSYELLVDRTQIFRRNYVYVANID